MRQTAGKIAVVFHDFPLGGSERIAIRLMNTWAKAGRHVTAFCGAMRGPLAGMIGGNIEVVSCTPEIPRGGGSRRRLGNALAAFLDRGRPDALFIPGNFHWPVLPAVARLPRDKRPVIIAQISTPLFRHGRGPLEQAGYNMLTRYRFGCVDRAIALSPSMVSDADRILGRPITQFIRLPVLDGNDDGGTVQQASGKTIVAAGRMVAEKGFDVALRAFAHVNDPEARLIIVGDGPRRAQLKNLAQTLGVADRVEMPGYVPDISAWLAQARVFLMSSFYEGFGAVIVEALAAGRPVVSTDCTPAVHDLLYGLEGCAVAPIGDARKLGEALRSVLAQPAPQIQSLTSAVAGYSMAPIADEYLGVFDSIHAAKLRSGLPATQQLADGMAYV
jgi:glycosyltransferase involved in cell wall biosynthesis